MGGGRFVGVVKTENKKRVRLEMTMLLPEGVDLNSAAFLARITEALEGLPGGDQVKIERLKFDPG